MSNNNGNKDWTNDDDNNEQLPANQLSNSNDQDVDSVVRDIVNNVQSQDMFSNPPPAMSASSQQQQQKKNKKKNRNSQQGGILPKMKPSQQLVFTNDEERNGGRNRGDDKITAAMYHNATRLHKMGEGSSSSSSSSSPATLDSSNENNNDDNTTNNDTNTTDVSQKARHTMECFTRQLINPKTTDKFEDKRVEQLLKELTDFYVRQIVLKDRATRNLDNINHAKERNGRVPVGMQIKVTPEVLGNNEVKFKQAWAQALTQAEDILSTCIVEHLKNYILNIDHNICDRVNQVLDILLKSPNVEDPIEMLKETLNNANVERNKINDEIRKRKREGKDKDKDAPPNKKFKKS